MVTGHKNTMTFLDSSIIETEPGIYEVLILTELCKGNHFVCTGMRPNVRLVANCRF